MSDVRTPLDWMRRHRDHHQPDPSPVLDVANDLQEQAAKLRQYVTDLRAQNPALKEIHR